MLFSLDWLRELVPLEESPGMLARRLTMAGLPVERIEGGGTIPGTVVVARVLETRRHPNADRLTLCTVDAGGGRPSASCAERPTRAPACSPPSPCRVRPLRTA